jgi:DNA-directed RNA polymerase specialized sigma subunit
MNGQPSIKTIKELPFVKERLFNDLGREPLNEEIATEMGIDLEDAEEAQKLKVVNEDEQQNHELKFKLTIKNHELEKLREKFGLTQEQCAMRLKIGSQTFGAIERCVAYPTNQQIKVICNFFGETQEKLFPEWLRAFTKNWKNAEHEKIMPISQVSLNSPETMFLEEPDYGEKYSEMKANNSIIRERVLKFLDTIKERNREIFMYHFGFDGSDAERTFRETANHFQLTGSRVQQIINRILEQMRAEKKFSKFLAGNQIT